MLSVSEAQNKILDNFQPVEKTRLALAECAGRVLAEMVTAETDLPLFDNSSVDGFAVCASDVATVPVNLRVVADIPAGSVAHITLKTGEAARIMTGAPMPLGADAVVMVEDTDFQLRTAGTPAPVSVTIHKRVGTGANIRYHGSDVQAGQEILPVGRRLTPQDVGMMAMLGKAQVWVYRKPCIAILSSGDELVPVDAPVTPGKIRESNSYALAALANQSGVEVIALGVAPDQRGAVTALLDRAAESGVDAIVSSAGVSVGAFDFVKEVVEAQGALDFWKVNMRPGKPLAFGQYRGTPFFGLPGNPVSAFIGFLVFVAPALDRLSGVQNRSRDVRNVKVMEAIESDGRESYLRAVVSNENGQLVARLTGQQSSGNMLSLVQANALLIIPSGVKSVPLGAELNAWLL